MVLLFRETSVRFHSRARLVWGCTVGFLQENLQHWNEGSLAGSEVAEDSESDLWNAGTAYVCSVASFVA